MLVAFEARRLAVWRRETARQPARGSETGSLGNEDDLPHVAALGEDAVRVAGAVERDLVGDDGLNRAVGKELLKRGDPGLERAAVVPEAQDVQADDRLGLAHLLDEVEAAEHRER